MVYRIRYFYPLVTVAATIWLLAAAAASTRISRTTTNSKVVGAERSSPNSVKVAAASSPCAVSAEKPCVIDLHGAKAPGVSANCTTQPWSRILGFPQTGRVRDSNKDGWWETVLAIDLDPGTDCSCARLRVFFEAPVTRWTVNVGDSPTNNGYGGDEGTTFHEAEMQILGDSLTVLSASRRDQGRFVDTLLDLKLPPLGDRYLELTVCDQSLGVELSDAFAGGRPLRFTLQTPNWGLLYALAPSRGADGSAGKRLARGIYAAFNRVIHDASGTPAQERNGTGVRRIEVTLAR